MVDDATSTDDSPDDSPDDSGDDTVGVSTAMRRAAAVAGSATVGIGQRWGRGSGVVVAPGRVLTNAHNVADGEVGVVFDGGRREVGMLAAADVDAELAVVTVDTGDVEPVTPSTAGVELGDLVVAVANPGGRGIHVTPGWVSAVGRRFRGPRRRRVAGAIEHTAPLVRGSSGGPVLDRHGRWIGLNTHRLDGLLYLALPVDQAMLSAVDELARGETPGRPRLGIAVAPSATAQRLRTAVGLDERDGLLVREVAPAGPADRAGVRRGDLLVAVDGVAPSDIDDLHVHLAAHDPASPLVLSVVRGVDEHEVTVDLSGA